MNNLALVFYYLISFLVFITPRFALRGFANCLAYLIYLATAKVRNVIVKNLSHFTKLLSEDEAKKMSLKVYKRFVYYVLLMVKNQHLNKAKLLEQISEFKNYEEFERLLASGKQVIFTTAHFSYWELLPSAVALRFNCPISVVGRALKPACINKRLVAARQAYGVELIDKEGAIKGILKASKNGRIIGLVSDQDSHPAESIESELYGYKVTQSKSAALMAAKLNAYLIPVYIYPNGDKFIIEFFPAKSASEADLIELSEYQLQTTKQMFERYISEYFWFHKRFKTFYEDEY